MAGLLVSLAFSVMVFDWEVPAYSWLDDVTATYRNGVVTIYAYKQYDSYGLYLGDATHEWAHHIWTAYLSREDRLRWDGICWRKGWESGYPYKDSTTAASQEEEEFATCAELLFMNSQGYYDGSSECSEEKYEFIREVWR